MKSITHDESADAFGWAIVLIAVMFSSILFIALSIGVNFMTDIMNVGISEGMVSMQTSTHYGMGLKLWGAALLFVLFDIVLWGLNRVQITKDEGL